MQSPMITINPSLIPQDLTHPRAVRGGFSQLRVLQSAAGFYVGTAYEEYDANGALVWQEPGSRDSGYYASEDLAAQELRQFKGGDLSQARLTP